MDKSQRQDSARDQLESVALAAKTQGFPTISEWILQDWDDWSTKLDEDAFDLACIIAMEEGCRDALDAMENRQRWRSP